VIAFGVLIGLLITGVVLVIPVLLREFGEFTAKIPQYTQQAYDIFTRFMSLFGLKPESAFNSALYEKLNAFSGQLGEIARGALANMANLAQTLILYIYSPILTFFLLKDGDKLAGKMVYLLPMRWRRSVVRTVKQIDTQLWRYISSLLLTAGAVALLTTLGLWAAGVNYAPVLGLIVGLLDLIPFLGPVISIVPIVTVASLQGLSTLIWALGILLAVQQIESFVLNPLIVGGNLKLHPAVIVLTVLVGNLLFGVMGMIFSVPAVLVVRVICRNIYLSSVEAGGANSH
jgi:predicted PurR-regulated permease PerM